MKVNIPAHDLARAVKVVRGVAEKKTVLPVISGMKLVADAEKGVLELFSSDMEVFLKVSIPAGIEESGSAVVNSFPFGNVIFQFTEPVSIERKDKGLEVRSGRSRYVFPFHYEEDFLQFPKVEGERVKVDGGSLVYAFTKVSYALSKDVTREPVFAGVCLRAIEGELYVLASDKVRLAEVRIPNFPEEVDVILPSKLSSVFSSLMQDEEEVEMVFGEEMVEINGQNWTLIARTIDGEFPNHLSLLPDTYELEFEVEKKELARALKRASAVLGGDYYGISLYIRDGIVRLESQEEDEGEVYEEMEVQVKSETAEGKARFTIKYLSQAVEKADGDTCLIRFPVAEKPNMVVVEQGTYRALISTRTG